MPPGQTDKLNEILEQLTRLDARYEAFTETIAARLDHIERKQAKTNDLLDGAGGLIVRVDRLEQTEQRRGKMIGTAIAASITSIVAWLFQWLKSHP